MIRPFIFAVCLLAFLSFEAHSQGPPPEPPGYRMEDYRAPTPATLAGARVVTTNEAEDLWKAGASFVDVVALLRVQRTYRPKRFGAKRCG
jgi:hypothetical protein